MNLMMDTATWMAWLAVGKNFYIERTNPSGNFKYPFACQNAMPFSTKLQLVFRQWSFEFRGIRFQNFSLNGKSSLKYHYHIASSNVDTPHRQHMSKRILIRCWCWFCFCCCCFTVNQNRFHCITFIKWMCLKLLIIY